MGLKEDNKGVQGVYATHPLATPRYSLGGANARDFLNTHARIYLSTPVYNPPSHLAALAKTLTPPSKAPAVPPINYGYVDFVLQRVEHAFREKVDVIEMLADTYVAYFFGEAADQWTFSGTFLNTKEDDQFTAFYEMYHNWLRGTKLADARRNVIVEYNGYQIHGAITALHAELTGEMEMSMPFSFTLLVRRVNPQIEARQFNPQNQVEPTGRQETTQTTPGGAADTGATDTGAADTGAAGAEPPPAPAAETVDMPTEANKKKALAEKAKKDAAAAAAKKAQEDNAAQQEVYDLEDSISKLDKALEKDTAAAEARYARQKKALEDAFAAARKTRDNESEDEAVRKAAENDMNRIVSQAGALRARMSEEEAARAERYNMQRRTYDARIAEIVKTRGGAVVISPERLALLPRG